MTFPRITALLLATLLSATATDPGTNCGPGQVNLFGGNPNEGGVCLSDGSSFSFNLQQFHDDEVNVVASPYSTTADPIQCVKFWLTEDGAGSPYYYNKEKNAPYSLYGNDGLTMFGGQPHVGDNQTLTVCSYSDDGCKDEIVCIYVTLDVTNDTISCIPYISYIDFHDAEDDTGYYDWFATDWAGPFEICLPASGQIAIQATTSGGGCIDKVRMKLKQDGTVIANNIEKDEPFSLFGNSGGDMYGASLPAGNYTLTLVLNLDPAYSESYDFTLVDCD